MSGESTKLRIAENVEKEKGARLRALRKRPIGAHALTIEVYNAPCYCVCYIARFRLAEFSVDRCANAGTPADADLTAFNSTCYEFVTDKGNTFQQARNYCKNRGGDLVHGFKVISSPTSS